MGEASVQKKDPFWEELQEMEDRIMRRADGISRHDGSESRNDLDDCPAAEPVKGQTKTVKKKDKSKVHTRKFHSARGI